MRWRLVRPLLAVAGVAAGGIALAWPPAGDVAVQVVGWCCIALALYRLSRIRARGLAAWYLFAGAGIAVLLGGLVLEVHGRVVGVDSPFPSPADAFFVLEYVLLLVGLIVLIRARSATRERDNVIDALIVTVGVGVLAWATQLGPYVRDSGVPLEDRILNIAYSTLTLLVLGLATRVAVGPGARTRSYYLLATAVSVIFTIDVLTTLQTTGSYDGNLPVALFPFAAVPFTLAALHPSMAALTEAPKEPARRLTGVRFTVLACVLLVPPGLLVWQLTSDRTVDLPVVVCGWVLLALLVFLRMTGLVRANEQVADDEQILRRASEQLVSATSSAAMYDASLAATRELVGDVPGFRASVALLRPGGPEVIAAIGRREDLARGSTLRLSVLSDAELGSFHARRTITIDDCPPLDLAPPDPGAAEGVHVVLVPLVSRDELRGALVVSTTHAPRRGVVRSIRTVAAELSLALESAALVQEIHRQESERRFRALVQYSSDVVAVVDDRGRVTYVSPSVKPMLGYDPEQLLDRNLLEVFRSDLGGGLRTQLRSLGSGPFEQFGIELQIEDVEGVDHTVDVTFTDLRDESSVAGIVINARDVTVRKHLEHDLRHQAMHDALTGLGNRALFLKAVEDASANRSDRSTLVGVLFIDLDDFKTVNDSLGHAVGDELLVAVSERLHSCLRPDDLAARLGGDEFALLVLGAHDRGDVEAVAERVLTSIREPFHVQGREISVTTSAGIHVDRAGSCPAEDALRNADTAMYRAKDAGKNRYEVFDEGMLAGVHERLELKADLARGIDAGQLVLRYQPIVELRTGRIRGVEALVRWQHPERGLLPPGAFIPIAEDAGLIVTLGRWVLQEACRQAASWSRGLDSENEMSMSVNLSVRQLQEMSIVEDIASALQEYGLDPRRLVLEITESVVMADADLAAARLDALRSLGVRIAIDDFGTGYSSLGYVQRLPLDLIKIDRSFVDGLGVESGDGQVVNTVIDLARRLGVPTVAEGIEGPVQLAALQALGCEYGQGFYFAHPSPAEDIAELLADGAPIAATYSNLVRSSSR